MKKILVAEDEERLCKMITDYLEAVGFEAYGVLNGRLALREAREGEYDLLVLDIMMPELTGYQVLSRLRDENMDIPVIVLTARSEEGDKLKGLNLGADDYMTKPFSMKELAARIKAVLRRTSGPDDEISRKEIIQAGRFTVKEEAREITKDGHPIPLSALQFDLLHFLMLNQDRVFTRDELLSTFRSNYFEGYERTIDVHVKNLRKLIEDDPKNPEFIKTIWGVGYKFTLEKEETFV